MIAPHTAAPESRTRLRRCVSIGLVLVGVVMLVAVAAWLLLPSSVPPARFVGWKSQYGGSPFVPATAQTTTVIPVEAEWPACAPDGVSWQGTPVVTCTPVSVTIHPRMTDTAAATCADRHIVGTYLSGIYVPVQLSEPLGGRALLDGSSSPAAAPVSLRGCGLENAVIDVAMTLARMDPSART